ncbi:MAG: AMP-binding protein [Phycisphaerales bacterium]|nr:AMP-binding protein [Phycisphaerales bacterium]
MGSIYSSKPWLANYKVAAELPIPTRSVIEAFEDTVRRDQGAPAIHYFDHTISFGRLNELAGRFATMLARWGVRPGDRVALAFQNDPQFAIAQLGAWKRGAIVVPLNPMFKQREIDYYLADSGARVWVGLDTLDRGQHTVERYAPVSIDDAEMMCVLSEFEVDESVRVPIGADDVAYLVYTSGTTGDPKGAICLHRNVLFNAEVYRAWMGLTTGDAVLGMAPLFHITGLVAQLAVSAVTGAPLILFHRFDAVRALELAAKWNATFSVAAITAYIALMNANSPIERFVPKCYSGGAPVPRSVTERFESRFGSYIHNIYGLTESNSPSHATPLGARAPVDPASGALSIGVPIPNCEAKIVDLADPSRELPAGEAGELALKGPMMFSGYWNKPQASAAAFHDGYFLTGDVALMDESGWFYIVDRKKDMIVASGFKVWPREVEDILYEHPAVREAAVIGAPDDYRGETVKAFVALRGDYHDRVEAADIIHFCKERLATYKCPRDVEFVAEIPKTATGKFLRRALRS